MSKRLTVQLAGDSGQWTDSTYLDDPIRAAQFAWTMASTNPRVKASRIIDTYTGQPWLTIWIAKTMSKLTYLTLILLLIACAPTPANPDVVNWRFRITNGQQPVEATIHLYWPDTNGDLDIGPTSDITLPIPADGAPISVTVTAPNYFPWSRTLTASESLDLIVTLNQESEALDL